MQYTITYGLPSEPRSSGRFVFVVSHMRSYSSLLCHILGSHPEISGYAEAQLSYLTSTDLRQLARMVRGMTERSTPGRYVLDKILHNHLEIAPAILSRPDVKVIFLVRRAEETITSILHMYQAMGYSGPFSEPERVLDYYVTRLGRIQAYSEQLARGALLIAAECLIADTAATLATLSQWLNLGTPLSPVYRTFKFTGKSGFGDPSPNIMAGKIVPDAAERHRGRVPIDVLPDLLARGNAAYAAHWDQLVARSDVR